MPAEVHFATFVAAFVATLEYAMEGAQAAYKNRVRTVRGELEQVKQHWRSTFVDTTKHSWTTRTRSARCLSKP